MRRFTFLLVFIFFVMAGVTIFDSVTFGVEQCNFVRTWPLCSGEPPSSGWVRSLSVSVVFLLLSYSAWRSFGGHEEARKKRPMWPILLLVASAVLVIPFSSTDIRYYFGVGQAAWSANPYVSDWVAPATPLVAESGLVHGVMYGPLSVRLMQVVYWLSGGQFVFFSLLWKFVMLITLIVVARLAERLSLLAGANKPLHAVVVATQPLLLWEWVVAGHFDGVWIALLLAACVWSIQKRWPLVALALALGVWVKFVPIFCVPVFALWWWHTARHEAWRARLYQFLSMALVFILTTVIAWIGLWQGRQVFDPIILQSKWAVQSIFSALYYSAFPYASMLLGAGAHWWLTRILQALLAVCTLYMIWPLCVRAYAIFRNRVEARATDFITLMFVGLSAYLLVWQKSFWPWYSAWLLPLGAVLLCVRHEAHLFRMVRYLASMSFILYIPFLLVPQADTSVWFFIFVAALVIGPPLYQLWRWRQARYDF